MSGVTIAGLREWVATLPPATRRVDVAWTGREVVLTSWGKGAAPQLATVEARTKREARTLGRIYRRELARRGLGGAR